VITFKKGTFMSTHHCKSTLAGLLLLLASSCSDSAPSFEGTWDCVSNHDTATGSDTPVTPGMFVADYHDGVVTLYLNDGTNPKGCGTQTYTVEGDTITFANGGKNVLEVTGKTLRLTTLKDGKAIGYSEFVRLDNFKPEGYGTCGGVD
jgi:hypothetical protein